MKFSEKKSSKWFCLSLVLLLLAFVDIIYGYKFSATILIVVGGLVMFGPGLPYFSFVLKGYYPSGYYVPVEEVNKLTDRYYANANPRGLSYYRIHRSFIPHGFDYVAEASIPKITDSILSGTNDYKKAISLLAYIYTEGNRLFTPAHTENWNTVILAKESLDRWQSVLREIIKSRSELSQRFEYETE